MRSVLPQASCSRASPSLTLKDSAEVSALVRSVIVTYGLPFAVLAVTESVAGWNIHLRAGTGCLVSIAVPKGRPFVMRLAIRELLEAEL
jgi:hypothetical protein